MRFGALPSARRWKKGVCIGVVVSQREPVATTTGNVSTQGRKSLISMLSALIDRVVFYGCADNRLHANADLIYHGTGFVDG